MLEFEETKKVVDSQGAVTPIDAVVSAATGVTICDRPKTSVTL